jgi:tRNA modification GTPase
MDMKNTTIAAVSTPPGTGGISSIRLSGSDAFNIASSIFSFNGNFSEISSHTVTYGRIVGKNIETIDEVLLLKMKAPSTYTREDVVEIQCHGNAVVVARILEMLYSKGALPAQPGEFTKRAFMNGRIDLSQAEAVMDVINSTTEQSKKSALRQLEGAVGSKVNEIRREIIHLLSHIGVSIDYPEYEDEAISLKSALDQVELIKDKLEILIENYDTGKLLREGVDVAVIGPPNAGKSTFINKVTGQEKSIVTHIPGTTRDVLEIHFSLKGFPIVLHDTAGIRETEDLIEKIGIEKTLETRDRSQIIVVVLDALRGLDKETKKIIDATSPEKTIYAINKTDIGKDDVIHEYLDGNKCIYCSFINGKGVSEVLDLIYSHIMKEGLENGDIAITNSRHKLHIDNALLSISDALKTGIENGYIDVISIDLSHAAEELGKITGETAGEDIIENIFRNFCVGK